MPFQIAFFYHLPNNWKDQIIRSEWQIAMIEVFENGLWEERWGLVKPTP
jgi:hypothetical protein